MKIRFDLVDGPASEPVTVAEAKLQAKIDISEDDSLVAAYITAARDAVERATGRALMTQEWTATLDCWPALEEGARHRRIRLAHFPIASVDAISVDGVALDTDLYRLDGKDVLVSIEATDSEREIDDTGIVIEFTAGYGAASDVPQGLKLALMQQVAHLYEARGTTSPAGVYHQVIPFGVDFLLTPYKVLEI